MSNIYLRDEKIAIDAAHECRDYQTAKVALAQRVAPSMSAYHGERRSLCAGREHVQSICAKNRLFCAYQRNMRTG